MAHGEDVRRKVRAGYVFDGLDLESAARRHQVPEATARSWKRKAREAGDDWDKARGAQMLAGGSVEEVLRQTMALMIRQVQATIEAVEQDADMGPAGKTQLLASCADSTAKLTAAMRRMMPETDALAVRMDTLRRMAEFVHTQHPQHAEAFSELLKPMGEMLAHA